MYLTKTSELVGNTPLLELPLNIANDWHLLLKLEKFNPGQSMKDRMAINMVKQAELNGELKPGGIIIESSSGNTGVGLSIIAAERGYKFIAIVDHHAAKDKIAIMKAYGAQIIKVDSSKYAQNEVAVKEREALAKKLSEDIPNSVFLQQADNPANAEGYTTLGMEIIKQTNGKISSLIGSVGTGGSLCGTARRLKEFNPEIEVIGVEPFGSVIFGGEEKPYFQSGTGNPGNVSIGKNVIYGLIDQGLKVSDEEAFNTARYLARTKGLLVGGAAGGVIYMAIQQLRQKLVSGHMVAIIADGGEKYLDTVFDDEWMQKNNLISNEVENNLRLLIK